MTVTVQEPEMRPTPPEPPRVSRWFCEALQKLTAGDAVLVEL